MAQAPVTLNIYNMHWLNEYISTLGIGVYHSGVEVYGREYAFGGHPFEFTGIFDMQPKDVEELGEGFTFKESILLGRTDFNDKDITKLIDMLGKTYAGSTYHLIRKNCNHFSSDFSKLICDKHIPNWVNRLATIGIRFPFLVQCIPKDWLMPDPDSLGDFIDMTEWVEIDDLPNSTSKHQNAEPTISLGIEPDHRNGECIVTFAKREHEPVILLTEYLAEISVDEGKTITSVAYGRKSLEVPFSCQTKAEFSTEETGNSKCNVLDDEG